MKNVKTIGKEYQIYSVSGEVLDSQRHYETKVSGHGGGGYTNQGTGFSNPVTISSTTVVHDTIFLKDTEGKEHSIELQNFDVVSRTGNQMTAVWAIKKNKKRGPYVAIINHTLSKISFNGRKIFLMMTPHWGLLLIALILTGVIIKSGLLSLLVVFVWAVFGYVKAKDVKAEIDREYNTSG